MYGKSSRCIFTCSRIAACTRVYIFINVYVSKVGVINKSYNGRIVIGGRTRFYTTYVRMIYRSHKNRYSAAAAAAATELPIQS